MMVVLSSSRMQLLCFLCLIHSSRSSFLQFTRPRTRVREATNVWQRTASSLGGNNRYSSNLVFMHQDDDPFGDYDDDDYHGESQFTSQQGGKDEKPSAWEVVDEEKKTSHFFSKKPLEDPTFIHNDDKSLFQRLCRGAGIDRPSRIQSLSWPVLLQGKHAIVADQTGSGKTLAYLIPLLQKALINKKKQYGAPRILVLAPTAELADQIHKVCQRISQEVPIIKTMVITATGSYNTNIRDQIRLLQRQPVDVLISTPGRIATILRTKDSGLDLTQLQALVLDEVDVLLIDETFGPQLRTVGVATPMGQTQFVFCTATLPDDIVETVEKEFASVVQIRGPGLHRVAPTLKEHLVDVSVPSQSNRNSQLCFDIKAKQLLKALRQHKCRRTLIFCNTVQTCRAVENLLQRHDKRGKLYHVSAYHNAMSFQARNKNLATFSNTNSLYDEVLICTDRAARGVDFDASPVDHVVLFDFPNNPAEYVRRVGRTARAGRTGTSTVLAYGWQLPIARSIMGKKLDSFSVAIHDEEDGDEEEYSLQKKRQGRAKRQARAEKEKMIKGNIEGGRMWKDKKKY